MSFGLRAALILSAVLVVGGLVITVAVGSWGLLLAVLGPLLLLFVAIAKSGLPAQPPEPTDASEGGASFFGFVLRSISSTGQRRDPKQAERQHSPQPPPESMPSSNPSNVGASFAARAATSASASRQPLLVESGYESSNPPIDGTPSVRVPSCRHGANGVSMSIAR